VAPLSPTALASLPETASPPGLQAFSGSGSQTGAVTTESNSSILKKFSQDWLGNGLAVIVLAGMLASAFGTAGSFLKPARSRLPEWPDWIILLLCALGLFVAAYLSYVETTHTSAACGPVGDCNSVQQSSYAYVFGIIPIGVLGLIGYAALLLIWIIWVHGPAGWRNKSAIAGWIVAGLGMLFSSYLTFLEPFVIGATCAWCLTSAVIMTLILWGFTKPAVDAWKTM
jgi:uncharacterized membrane protein